MSVRAQATVVGGQSWLSLDASTLSLMNKQQHCKQANQNLPLPPPPARKQTDAQAAPRVFVNDVIVRFHKSLELEEDEVKTLICRYPPPLAPIPADGTALAGR